jgi:hypothetical protein
MITLINSENKKQKMWDKERREHPSFTDEQIWTIVEDHLREGSES